MKYQRFNPTVCKVSIFLHWVHLFMEPYCIHAKCYVYCAVLIDRRTIAWLVRNKILRWPTKINTIKKYFVPTNVTLNQSELLSYLIDQRFSSTWKVWGTILNNVPMTGPGSDDDGERREERSLSESWVCIRERRTLYIGLPVLKVVKHKTIMFDLLKTVFVFSGRSFKHFEIKLTFGIKLKSW